MPAVEIASDRLVLRPFAPEDVDTLHAIFTTPEVRRYLLDDMPVPRSWVAEEVARSERAFDAHGFGLWSVGLGPDGPPIGFTGFREFHQPPVLELLYGLHPDHWGRGLALEAARCAARYGFEALGFDPVRAAIDVPNRASIRLAERLGFRETHRGPGEVHELVFFALPRERFDPGDGRFEVHRAGTRPRKARPGAAPDGATPGPSSSGGRSRSR